MTSRRSLKIEQKKQLLSPKSQNSSTELHNSGNNLHKIHEGCLFKSLDDDSEQHDADLYFKDNDPFLLYNVDNWQFKDLLSNGKHLKGGFSGDYVFAVTLSASGKQFLFPNNKFNYDLDKPMILKIFINSKESNIAKEIRTTCALSFTALKYFPKIYKFGSVAAKRFKSLFADDDDIIDSDMKSIKFMLIEYFENSKSLCEIPPNLFTDKDKLHIVVEVLDALMLAQKYIGRRFAFIDMHLGNILVQCKINRKINRVKKIGNIRLIDFGTTNFYGPSEFEKGVPFSSTVISRAKSIRTKIGKKIYNYDLPEHFTTHMVYGCVNKSFGNNNENLDKEIIFNIYHLWGFKYYKNSNELPAVIEDFFHWAILFQYYALHAKTSFFGTFCEKINLFVAAYANRYKQIIPLQGLYDYIQFILTEK